MRSKVVSIPVDLIDEDAIKDVNDLTDLTWPQTKPAEYTSESRIQDFIKRNPNKTSHFIYENAELIGYAESFPREIYADQAKHTIMGLGAVCVHPSHKGKGLGAQLVQTAFQRVDNGEFKLSLFQTGVPGFYHRLNCRTIENKIVNSQSGAPGENPFWDPYVIIYPREFIGFQSEIDLLGPGY